MSQASRKKVFAYTFAVEFYDKLGKGLQNNTSDIDFPHPEPHVLERHFCLTARDLEQTGMFRSRISALMGDRYGQYLFLEEDLAILDAAQEDFQAQGDCCG